METPPLPPGVRELPIVAAHPALDFANTVDDPLGEKRFDHIAGYPALLAWSVRAGTLPESAADALHRAAQDAPRRAAAVVHRAAALRDALNDTFGALAAGDDPGPGWAGLRPFVAEALGHAALTGPPPVLRWHLADLEVPLWPVAEAAYRLLTGAETARLKQCSGCPWLFVDRSKNGSRRWCAMDDCGRHEKIRRYVTKRAAGRRG
jgi:predicted RNA-binding Zn ribbon-like protein